VVVHGGEHVEFAVAQAVLAVVVQGELAIVLFHARAAALEEIGALGGDDLDLAAVLGVEVLRRRVRLAHRRQQLAGAVLRAATRSRSIAGTMIKFSRANTNTGRAARVGFLIHIRRCLQ
jgi:hypothetical protein